jgi:hypothetical protein
MVHKTSIMALVAIVAVATGLVGYFSTSAEVSPATSFATSGLLSGHLTLEVRDSDGNLKAYRESDNVIVANAENCVSKALFAPARYSAGGSTAGASDHCSGAITQPFAFIALGTGTTQEQNDDNDMQAQTALGGLEITLGSIAQTNSTGALDEAASTLIEHTFTNTSGGSVNISEAGLFNSTDTATNGMLAHKVFAAVSLADDDQLTVKWTVNMGNTTTFD